MNTSLRVVRKSPGLTWRALADDGEVVGAVTAFLRPDDRWFVFLDDCRADVPGSDGWVWDPGDFHEQTFGPDFDPATYLVAADISSGSYIGLIRIWVGRSRSRLGLIAVLPPYRRRGVARALLARAFGVLHERGQAEVSAEIDDTNTACLALLGGLGARRKGGTVEFVKHRTELTA